MFLDCNEMKTICDKAQYNEATLWQKVRHTIHLIICKACRGYSKNNSKLTSLINKSHATCLEEQEKAKMKDAINSELSKN